ncbi:hypothetical protein JVU11DRAFT_10676 [Chiua virens]|nr:hypothetical protein JVU11DRAFT_10676 [Chiua virens]
MPLEFPLPMVDSSSLRSSLADVPIFWATVIDEDDHHADLEDGGSEDDTKRCLISLGSHENYASLVSPTVVASSST